MDGNSSSDNVIAIKQKIEAIPVAMRNMGWTVSAALMERWLRSQPWVLPAVWKSNDPPDPRTLPSAHLDQSIVRMNWAMANPRVHSAIKELRVKMVNAAAKRNLGRRVAKLSWGTKSRMCFGTQLDSAVHLERTCQSNFQSFGGTLDTIDDLYGGLGMATLKVALIGEAIRDSRTGRLSLQVTHAGFYIRDTYDFRDFQYLGIWTKNGVLSKAQMLMNAASDSLTFGAGGEPIGNVFNHHFESYRRLTGFGGDFVLYSDVYWERVNLLLDLT